MIKPLLHTIIATMTEEFESVISIEPGPHDYMIQVNGNLALTRKGDNLELGPVSSAEFFNISDAWDCMRFIPPSKHVYTIVDAKEFLEKYSEKLNCALEECLHLARLNGVKFP